MKEACHKFRQASFIYWASAVLSDIARKELQAAFWGECH